MAFPHMPSAPGLHTLSWTKVLFCSCFTNLIELCRAPIFHINPENMCATFNLYLLSGITNLYLGYVWNVTIFVVDVPCRAVDLL
jgi:hypothetical protein